MPPKPLFNGELAETTLRNYTSNIKRLNGDKIPTNADFLKDPEVVKKFLEKYTPNTRKTYYITIVSYLKGKRFPKATAKIYYDIMMDENKLFRESSNEKTEKQKENWITWAEVQELYKALDPKSIEHLTASLYVLTPPRRIKDYRLMKVVPEWNETMDMAFNYMDWKNNNFIYNQYKTKGKYQSQVIPIPQELQDVIHSHFKLKKKFEPFFLLGGETMTPENGITRILNRAFKKPISANMLRNIYLTDTFGAGIKEFKDTTDSMGTSMRVAQDVYIKSS
jgi:integrase